LGAGLNLITLHPHPKPDCLHVFLTRTHLRAHVCSGDWRLLMLVCILCVRTCISRFELLVDRHSTELTITVMDWERFGSDRHVGTAKVTVQELIDKAGKDVSINVLRPASTKLLLGKDAEPCILNLFWEFLSGPLQEDVRTVDGRQKEDDERRETNGAATWLRSNGDERTRGSEWNGRGENGERRNRGHTDEGRKGRGRGKENGKGRSPEPRQISIESDFVYHDVDRMETVGTSSNFRNRPSSNPVELRSPRERTARGAHICPSATRSAVVGAFKTPSLTMSPPVSAVRAQSTFACL